MSEPTSQSPPSGPPTGRAAYPNCPTVASHEILQAHARHCWIALARPSPIFQPMSSLCLHERARRRLKPLGEGLSGPMPPAPPTSQSTQDTSEALAPLLETTLFVKPLTARDEALRAKAMESHRKAAIKKWMTLISVAGNAWEVARMSLLSDRPSDITGGLLQSVIDSLAGKATATLHARAGPLIRLVKFWADRGEVCFPVTEVQVYVFLKEVQDPAPTFPNSLLSSLRFARFTLGLIFVDGALESGRVRGVATQHYARKRRDVRRPALTVPQVKRLEDIVLDRGRGGHDRMAAGFFLFLVYGRLRYSDGLDVDDLADSSDGFLECTAERTKTQVGDAKKRKALPVVVPVASVGRAWIFEWFEIRKQMGLAVSGQNLTEPFLPAPASGGRWTRTPLPVSSGADWLRSFCWASRPRATSGWARIAARRRPSHGARNTAWDMVPESYWAITSPGQIDRWRFIQERSYQVL